MRSHQQTFEDFIAGRLPAGEWTHEAHLIACWMTLESRSPVEALPFLRDSITTHNCGVGTPNTETEGYHETLTIYYIAAVSEAKAPTPEALFEHPLCSRTAPLEHWTRELLFTPPARRGWRAPDIADLGMDVSALVDVALKYESA